MARSIVEKEDDYEMKFEKRIPSILDRKVFDAIAVSFLLKGCVKETTNF
jgi:hypothetical protein